MLLRPEDQVFPPAITFKPIPYRAIEGVAAARLALQAGFTTVRDTGNEQAWHCDCALRDAITAGAVAGPRMFVATDTLSITGGDMRLDDRVNRELRLPELAEMVDTRTRCRRAVRRQVRKGADWIKVYATSTQMDLDPVTMEPLHQFDEDEMRLIVGEAKRFSRDVAAHAYGGAGALAAIRGGVRSLEHGPLLTDADIAAMVEEGTYWVPTLSTYRKLGPYWEKQPAEFHQRFVERHRSSFERAWAAGVKIAFGTDVGSFPHGEQRYEFELLVEYGMTPVEALTTATSTAASLLRRAGELGTLTAGAVADLVAVAVIPPPTSRRSTPRFLWSVTGSCSSIRPVCCAVIRISDCPLHPRHERSAWHAPRAAPTAQEPGARFLPQRHAQSHLAAYAPTPLRPAPTIARLRGVVVRRLGRIAAYGSAVIHDAWSVLGDLSPAVAWPTLRRNRQWAVKLRHPPRLRSA